MKRRARSDSSYETASFELFGEEHEAGSIPSENLHVVAAAVDEEVEIAGIRVLISKDLLHQREQPLKGFCMSVGSV